MHPQSYSRDLFYEIVLSFALFHSLTFRGLTKWRITVNLPQIFIEGTTVWLSTSPANSFKSMLAAALLCAQAMTMPICTNVSKKRCNYRVGASDHFSWDFNLFSSDFKLRRTNTPQHATVKLKRKFPAASRYMSFGESFPSMEYRMFSTT